MYTMIGIDFTLCMHSFSDGRFIGSENEVNELTEKGFFTQLS